MQSIVAFISSIRLVLYILAGTGIFFSIRGLVMARRDRRIAVYALEREAAQQQQRRSLNTILFMLVLVSVVYITSNIVQPNLDASTVIEPTPTSLVFVTNQPTATVSRVLYPTVTPTAGIAPADAEDLPPTPDQPVDGCAIIGANTTEPSAGQSVSGQVAVSGQANILNFSEYKFEIRGPSTEDAWIVVGTFTSPVPDGFLGTWDSTSIPPGDYVFRMVVLRADGTFPTPCETPITVLAASGAPAP